MALAWRISFSTSSAVNSFPYNQALALSSSCFGRCPSLVIDLKRLNTNSTCHRTRYQSQDRRRREVGFGECREQNDVFGVFLGSFFPDLLAWRATLRERAGSRCQTSARAESTSHGCAGASRDRPGSHRSRSQVEPPAVVAQDERTGVDAHRDPAASRRNMGDSPGRGVASVAEYEVVPANRKPDEGLTVSGTGRRRDAEVVANQRRQTNAVVDVPERAGLPRLLDHRCVERPDFESVRAGQLDTALLEQRDAQGVEPVPRLAQPPQRNIRKVRDARLSGAQPSPGACPRPDAQKHTRRLSGDLSFAPLQGTRRTRQSCGKNVVSSSQSSSIRPACDQPRRTINLSPKHVK